MVTQINCVIVGDRVYSVIGLCYFNQSGVTELLIMRDPHCVRMCFKSVKTLGAYILSCGKGLWPRPFSTAKNVEHLRLFPIQNSKSITQDISHFDGINEIADKFGSKRDAKYSLCSAEFFSKLHIRHYYLSTNGGLCYFHIKNNLLSFSNCRSWLVRLGSRRPSIVPMFCIGSRACMIYVNGMFLAILAA